MRRNDEQRQKRNEETVYCYRTAWTFSLSPSRSCKQAMMSNKVLGLRVTIRAEHAHEVFGRFSGEIAQGLEAARRVDEIA